MTKEEHDNIVPATHICDICENDRDGARFRYRLYTTTSGEEKCYLSRLCNSCRHKQYVGVIPRPVAKAVKRTRSELRRIASDNIRDYFNNTGSYNDY